MKKNAILNYIYNIVTCHKTILFNHNLCDQKNIAYYKQLLLYYHRITPM